AAIGRCERPNNIEYIRRITIDARDSIIGWRYFRFFDDANDARTTCAYAFLTQFRNTESLGIRDFLEKDVSRGRIRHELIYKRSDGALENIITQQDAHRLPACEAFGERQRLRDTARFVLNAVGKRAVEI